MSQQQEIATMQMWLAAWYGTMHQPEMSRGAEQTMARIAGMAPEEFEISFMTMMIRHHWKAIVRSAQCVDRAYHEDLIAMCEDIIVAQAAEIELMRTWLCSWYDVCNYGPKGRPGDAVMIG